MSLNNSSIVSFCCYTKIVRLEPRLKFKVRGREIGRARQTFQSGLYPLKNSQFSMNNVGLHGPSGGERVKCKSNPVNENICIIKSFNHYIHILTLLSFASTFYDRQKTLMHSQRKKILHTVKPKTDIGHIP